MTLKEILKNNPILNTNVLIGTDKDTDHSYITHFYEKEFIKYKDLNINLLEIGTGTGGCLSLWKEYFRNGEIYGIDIRDYIQLIYKNNDINYIFEDAYNFKILDKLPNFDIIIDDGPHIFELQRFVLQDYTKKLNKNGILIIEDIVNIETFESLKNTLPKEEQSKIELIDLRPIKNRFDDILLVYRN